MPYCGQGATLWRRNPLLITINFTYGHLLKIERLVTDVTAVRSPDIATFYLGGDFGWALFWLIQAVFVVGEPLCGVGTPS